MELKHFRFWCQKVLPLVYDDSLSYYELLCKVVDKLNELIDNYTPAGEAFKEFQNEIQTEIAEINSEIEKIKGWQDNFYYTYISAPANTDITDQINEALEKGGVILDGKDYAISGITTDNYCYINGNGSKLTCNTAGDYVITIGHGLEGADPDNDELSGLTNLTIDCKELRSGIHVKSHNQSFTNVHIKNPATYGFNIEDGVHSSDCQLINCYVDAKTTKSQTGFFARGFDNSYINCRTINMLIGFDAGSGDYFYYCHPTGGSTNNATTGDVIENSIAFVCHYGAQYYGCFADSFNFGFNLDTTGEQSVIVENPQFAFWPQAKVTDKVCFQIRNKAHVKIDNPVIPNRPDIVALRDIETHENVRNLSNLDINMPLTLVKNKSDDLCKIAYFTEEKDYYISVPTNTTSKIGFAVGSNYLIGDFGPKNFSCDIVGNQFSISDITGTHGANGPMQIISPGTPGAYYPDPNQQTITVGAADLNGQQYLFVQNTADTNHYFTDLLVRLRGVGIEYLNQSINLDNATVTYSKTWTLPES